MNALINKRIVFTIGFIVALYMVLTILLGDIFFAKDFNIGIKTLPLLILSIIMYGVFYNKFIVSTEIPLPNTQIITIIVISFILSFSVQFIIKTKDYSDFSAKKFTNPLYKEFIQIGKKNNLDLSFTKDVWIQRGPNNYKINSIFEEQPKSIDILFFGDSSIAWGFIPSVVEQMTGKKVAMYAYESNFLTEKTSQLFNKISEYYLKDDGMVIFSFDNWTKDKAPNDVRISKNECDEIISWSQEEFRNHAKKFEKSFYDKYISFDSFHSYYDPATIIHT